MRLIRLPRPRPWRRGIAVLGAGIAGVLAAGVWAATTGDAPRPAREPATPASRTPGCPEADGCDGIDGASVRLGLHLTAGSCDARVPVALPPGEAGPAHWAAFVNRVQGGVHGRTVEVAVADDGGCRDGAAAAAAHLFDDVGVVAVGGLSGWEAAAGAAAEAVARGAPTVEPGGPREWASMATFHQAATGFDVLFPALLRYVIGPAGLNRPEARIGILYRDVPEVAGPALRSVGAVPAARVVATIPVGERGIDAAAALRRLRQTGADVVACHCDPAAFIPFVAEADRAGYRPQYTFAGQAYDLDSVLTAFPADSTFTTNASGISPFCHPDHPCAGTHRRALAEIDPGLTVTQRTIRVVHTLELLIEPLRRVGPGVDRASYLRALGTLGGWSTGLTGPVDLAGDRSAGVRAFAVYESPGPGATAWRMADVGGRSFSASWGA